MKQRMGSECKVIWIGHDLKDGDEDEGCRIS